MDAFTIASWPTESRVTLCRVAWDSDYRDVVRFDTEQERQDYFNSLESSSIVLERLTYCKYGEPIRINIPFNACYNYNYLIVENPKLPVPGEKEPPRLYYFITGVAFNAPNCSLLTLQLDVFQTYMFDFKLGECFIERGHLAMKLMNDKVSYDENGNIHFSWSDARRYLTAPESLDIGNEYLIGWHKYTDLTLLGSTENESYFVGWGIIVMSTTNLEGSWGTVNKPNLDVATGQTYDGLVGGCNVYLLRVEEFLKFAKQLSAAPWVASGIISITAMPFGFFTEALQELDYPTIEFGHKGVYGYILPNTIDNYEELFLQPYPIAQYLRAAVKDYDASHFLKLLTYPYSVIEISPRNGSTLLLKPELFDTESINLRVLSCAVPGSIRICMYPYRYGAGSTSYEESYRYSTLDSEHGSALKGTIDGGFNVDTAIWFDNFPQLSLVNDNYMMYLAGSTNTREYQYNSAGWSLAAANMSAQASRDIFRNNYNTAFDNYQVGVAMNYANMVSGVIGNAAAGNIGGMISGAAGFGINTIGGNMQFTNTMAAQDFVNTTNTTLARDIAQGNYENAIAGINAAVQDAALTQPSLVGANGGNGFNLSNGLIGFDIRYKVPDQKHIKSICNYWGRYGYALREYATPPENLKCMEHFTYWKLQDSYITCAEADEGSKQIIRGIFERGVTVWGKPEEIGKIKPIENWKTI